ncbi:MAG: hypothetical protein HN900_01395 [Gammaproteobacteria bacterium]|nr:hypothetical protein [Gammaproteobacteria bacterium]MBT5793042.1 hypothetical protein [Gammaproteobacteria bacterium]MBT7173315.1 hypothetical protein [Gammaproteobacteria bacterium]
MKSIYLFFFSLILLAGCNETQPPLQEAAEAEAPVAEQTAEAEAPVAEQTTEATSLPIIEFVWHKKGPDFTEEAFTDAIAQWNGLIDAGDYDMQFASVAMAHNPNENLDFMWAIGWSSMEARNAGWQYWQANQEAQWQEMTSKLLTYSSKDAYPFAPTIRRRPDTELFSGTWEQQFAFCNYKDGYSAKDLASFETDYAAWLDEYEVGNGPTGYGYLDLVPQFEPDSNPDFVWSHLWKNAEEKAAGMAAWMAGPLAQIVDQMSSCQNFDFSIRRIRG